MCGKIKYQVVKQRVQAKQFGSSIQCLRHVVRSQGVKGLYVGFGATLMREVRLSIMLVKLLMFRYSINV